MRASVSVMAALLGLALAAPARAQDASDYWPASPTPQPKIVKPQPPASFLSKVKTFTAKAFDYKTYLPSLGTANNVINDPRLLPLTTAKGVSVNAADVLRPVAPVNLKVP